MSYIFEIAYAAESDRLCFFTGTGFSKAVSDNTAPSWQGLLEDLCEHVSNGVELKKSLFPDNKKPTLTLEEAAQVIAIELQKNGKDIHAEVANQIKKIKPSTINNQEIVKFLQNRSLRVVTTNYDKLFEQLCEKSTVQSLAPGLPIPRSKANVKVYHIHGSTDAPDGMVITSQDYFQFLHAESYFSRKLSTILHENTIVILGYSLGDTNLKSIINDYKIFTNNNAVLSSLIFVSRSEVTQPVKDYYSHCFGIRVIDNLETHDFFKLLNEEIPNVKGKCDTSLNNLKKVIYKGHTFTKDYIKIESSFFEIISSISAAGLTLINEKVISTLGLVIQTKKQLTTESGAWDQYEHLAKWLVHLASILDIGSTPIKDLFLETVLYSMHSMRRDLYIGYSWHAYRTWMRGWPAITAHNRTLIRTFVLDKSTWPDALSVVKTA